MKKVEELDLGFNDAENFRKRENRVLFNRLFTRTEDLDSLLDRTRYFLIGDKGTGKTALSIYLSNNDYKNTIGETIFIRETEYLKFVSLKRENQLTLSDYADIWKVILYLLISKQLAEKERHNVLFSKFSKFNPLKQAIEEFYNKAFSPEIIYAINFVEDSKRAAEILNEYFKLSGEDSTSQSFSESRFQINLLYIQKKFEEGIQSLNLEKDHIIFIDGIDIRPRNVDYEEYLECIKGLTNAVWNLNTGFFANIKGSRGRIKIVLLLRPDIFAKIGLQNLNNKIKDNSVLLDWRTTYPVYRNSSIFKLIDNILSSQQNKKLELGEAWDYYFPYQPYVYKKKEDSFISFLRFSMFKPRDIVSMLSILQENFKNEVGRKYPVFNESDFDNSTFYRSYSDYLLGEVKDYLAFYHTEQDYELFLKFFEFLEGKVRFNYDYYMDAYDKFADFIENNDIDAPIFFETSDAFLQFLFELNIICYVEHTEDFEPHIHWCFRERTYSNLNPKVKLGVEYSIHYGLAKAFNVGKRFRRRKIRKGRK